MFDMHHDLLSIMYYSYLRDDYSFLKEWLTNFNGDNVSGIIANLYFMNPDEMKKEIGDIKIDVVEMFEKSTSIFKELLPDTKYIFSIEGCDYIKDTNELSKLYDLGLRNILLVWNNPNKYGSGNVTLNGLTDLGKEFLIKAIDLGISIDLSHMNKNTFYDTIELVKEQINLGKDVKVIASHSNCYDVCNNIRNLDDEQLKALSSVNGLIGIVSYSDFTSNNNEDLKEMYLKHIKHAVDIMGIDNVGVSSDDMIFGNVMFSENYIMDFDYSSINNDIRDLLSNDFTDIEIDKILYKNVYNKLCREEK